MVTFFSRPRLSTSPLLYSGTLSIWSFAGSPVLDLTLCNDPFEVWLISWSDIVGDIDLSYRVVVAQDRNEENFACVKHA